MKFYKIFTVRPIEKNDLPLIYKWRNSDAVHSKMLTDHMITWDEHYAWFKNMEQHSVKRNFIFEYKNKPVGYIGYTEFDDKCHTCSPGAYIGPDVDVPQDVPLCMFFICMDYAFSYLGMVQLNTDVFADNKGVLKLDTFLGFEIIQGKEHLVKKNGKNQLVYRLTLNRNKWFQQKKELEYNLSLSV